MSNVNFIVDKEFIDFNNHLTESGFYHYGIKGLFKITKELGLMDLFNSTNCGLVTFETKIEFKKEIFEGDEINIKINFPEISDTGKWMREIDIYKANVLCATISSSGRMFNQLTRKVQSPPLELVNYMKKIN